jgi:hypothetical protein
MVTDIFNQLITTIFRTEPPTWLYSATTFYHHNRRTSKHDHLKHLYITTTMPHIQGCLNWEQSVKQLPSTFCPSLPIPLPDESVCLCQPCHVVNCCHCIHKYNFLLQMSFGYRETLGIVCWRLKDSRYIVSVKYFVLSNFECSKHKIHFTWTNGWTSWL